MKSLSRVRLLTTPWTAAYQAPPSMGLSRREYWSGAPLPSPSDSARSPIFPSGSVVKNLSAIQEPQEMRVRSLSWEDPLEKEIAIHSNTIAWKIPWTEEPGRLQPMGSQRVGHD